MMKWLTHQEKCHQFDAYLAWAYPQENEGGPDGGEKDLLDDAPEHNESTSFTLGYLVSRCPAYPYIPISSIIDNFGAPNFLQQLEITFTIFKVDNYLSDYQTSTPVLMLSSASQSTFHTPQVTKAITKDVIQPW